MSVSLNRCPFFHIWAETLLACTTVKSRKVLDVSPSALKENRLHHLRKACLGSEGVGHSLSRIFSCKIQDKKKRAGKRKQEM